MVSSARIPVCTTAFSSWGPSVTPCPGSWMRVSELPWCTTMVKCLGIGGQAEQCSSTGKMNTASLGWCYPPMVPWATYKPIGRNDKPNYTRQIQYRLTRLTRNAHNYHHLHSTTLIYGVMISLLKMAGRQTVSLLPY